jgi:membrane-anchored protein YejM (alkaline phosphatase superfamily)
MKAASLKEIKSALQDSDVDQLTEFCLRLIKFKKENKELLTYMIFESSDEEAYVSAVKAEIEEQFKAVSKGHVFFAKKTLRKILRYVNRQSRYSGIDKTELELRIFFCVQMIDNGIAIKKGTVIYNLYHQQLKKIDALIGKLPEDLQYDYEGDMKVLREVR